MGSHIFLFQGPSTVGKRGFGTVTEHGKSIAEFLTMSQLQSYFFESVLQMFFVIIVVVHLQRCQYKDIRLCRLFFLSLSFFLSSVFCVISEPSRDQTTHFSVLFCKKVLKVSSAMFLKIWLGVKIMKLNKQ